MTRRATVCFGFAFVVGAGMVPTVGWGSHQPVSVFSAEDGRWESIDSACSNLLPGDFNRASPGAREAFRVMAPEPLPAGLEAVLQAAAEQMDYYLTAPRVGHDGGAVRHEAANPAQRLIAAFTAGQLEVGPAGNRDAAWRWGLRLTRYGAGTDLRPAPAVQARTVRENRIEHRRQHPGSQLASSRGGVRCVVTERRAAR